MPDAYLGIPLKRIRVTPGKFLGNQAFIDNPRNSWFNKQQAQANLALEPSQAQAGHEPGPSQTAHAEPAAADQPARPPPQGKRCWPCWHGTLLAVALQEPPGALGGFLGSEGLGTKEFTKGLLGTRSSLGTRKY